MSREVGSPNGSPRQRPRWLVALAVLSFCYGSVFTMDAMQRVLTFTDSHDRVVDAAVHNADRYLGLITDLGTSEERERIAGRQVETLWARRGVVIPLAGASGISALLILLGCLRAVSRGGERSDWGRAAWQLGALIGMPCLGLEVLFNWVHAGDVLAAIAELHDPLAMQLRGVLSLRTGVAILQAAIGAVYLTGSAAYLGSAPVRRYFGTEAAS